MVAGAHHTALVGLGGFLGASLRYLVGGLVYRFAPPTFPYATFLVNVTGCFAIGVLASLAEDRFALGPGPRLFWMVGVLGGYTTFSTFGYETFVLLREGGYGQAAANAVGQVLLGLFGVWAGMVAARLLP
jgi:CrcB protein